MNICINTENKAFKIKVDPFIGAKALLIAIRFNPNKSGDALVLKEDADTNLLKEAKAKLEAAHATCCVSGGHNLSARHGRGHQDWDVLRACRSRQKRDRRTT